MPLVVNRDAQHMKAFQLAEWQQPAELREVEVPEPRAGEVLIKIGGSGACHSDLHLLQWPAGQMPFTLPFTLGHENAGWVEATGAGVEGLAAGDPVTVLGLAGGTLKWQAMGTLPWACSLSSTYWGSAIELIEVLELARSGRIRAHVERFALEDAATAYAQMAAGRLRGRAVICPNGLA